MTRRMTTRRRTAETIPIRRRRRRRRRRRCRRAAAAARQRPCAIFYGRRRAPPPPPPPRPPSPPSWSRAPAENPEGAMEGRGEEGGIGGVGRPRACGRRRAGTGPASEPVSGGYPPRRRRGTPAGALGVTPRALGPCRRQRGCSLLLDTPPQTHTHTDTPRPPFQANPGRASSLRRIQGSPPRRPAGVSGVRARGCGSASGSGAVRLAAATHCRRRQTHCRRMAGGKRHKQAQLG